MSITKKADTAYLKVALRCLEHDAILSKPLTECGARYDAIIDHAGTRYRVQIKYADGDAQSCGAVKCKLIKPKGHGISRPYTAEEIDAIVVYIPKIEKVCWFGPEVFVGKVALYMRYAEPLKKMGRPLLMLNDYIW